MHIIPINMLRVAQVGVDWLTSAFGGEGRIRIGSEHGLSSGIGEPVTLEDVTGDKQRRDYSAAIGNECSFFSSEVSVSPSALGSDAIRT